MMVAPTDVEYSPPNFRKPVLPGDRLDLHCELIRRKLRLSKMRGTAHVNGVLAAEAELTAAIVPKGDML